MEIISGEWGKTKVFPLPLVTYGGTDWISGMTLALGDVQIAMDGGAYANIPLGQLSVVADHIVITLLSANMQFGYAIVRIKDQDATKLFEDTGAILATNVAAWKQILFSLIESQRGTHTGEGEIIFWDAGNVTGNASDANSGLIYNEPKLTYNYNGANGVHDLLVDNGHQIIKGISGPGGGPVAVNEYVEVDTAYTFLRCNGRDWLFEATHNEDYAVLASAEGVEFSGFRVKSRSSGNSNAIGTTGDFCRMRKLWVDFSRGSGIVIDNASNCNLSEFLVQDSAVGGTGHAVHIKGEVSAAERNIISAGKIFENNVGNNTDGIRVDGANCLHNFIIGGEPDGLIIHENSGWGINEINGANHTIVIGPRVHLGHNDLGKHNLTGAGSVIENGAQWAEPGADDDDLKTLSDQMDNLTAVSVIASPGQFSQSFTTGVDEIEYPRKTQNSFAYDLDSNITGYTINFMAKKDHTTLDASAEIPLTDISAGVTDAVNGLGVVDLTESLSDIEVGRYYGEVQAVSGGVVVQRWFVKLRIIHNVIDG